MQLKAIVDEPGMFEGEYFQGKAFGRSARFFHTMSKQNLAEAWSKVYCKVLAVYGEFDVQALNARDAEVIAEIVNQSNKGNGEYLMLPKTEHIFAKVESYKQTSELYETSKFFQYAMQNYNPEVGRTTNDWMMGTGQNGTHMLVVTPDQKRIYTADVGSDSVSAFEFGNVPPAQSKVTQITVGKQPEAIDISPNGKEVSAGLIAEGAIDIVDTETNKVVEKVKLGERAYRIRFTPDGKLLVATMPNTKELIVIDTATRKEVKRIKLESAPLGLIFSKDGKTEFISATQSDFVLKIDLEKGEVVSKVAVGKNPDGIALVGM